MKMTFLKRTFCVSLLSILTTSFSLLSQAQIISTIAGNAASGFSGDGGAATAASLYGPNGVAIDGGGNVFFTDGVNGRVRKITPSGIISTVAGYSFAYGYAGDGGAATAAGFEQPAGIAIDGSGNIFVSDYTNNRIRKIDTSGTISTIAGHGTAGSIGDGGVATSAFLNKPFGLAIDGSGNLYVADQYNNRIRKITTSGIISTVAGNGVPGFAGDGGAATIAKLARPTGISIDGSGNMFIADYGNARIRKVNTSGVISTIAGNGTAGFSGDGGAATSAELNNPVAVVNDASGNVFIADQLNNRIRKVTPSGLISTVTGNGTGAYSGDGGPATLASIAYPSGMVINASGNLVFADGFNERIRNLCFGCSCSLPVVAAIYGAYSVLPGTTTTLTDATSGGVWSSSDTTVVTINAATGDLHAISSGTTTISYSVTNACGTSASATRNVTVCSYAGTITASATSLCAGGTAILTTSGSGGSWRSLAPSIATVSSTGVVTGVSSGTTSIRYTVIDACGTRFSSVSISSLSFGTVAAISGSSSICPGATATYTDVSTGGTWSSSNASLATISASGVVTAIAPGADTIRYAVSTACGTVTTSMPVIITGPSYPVAISGPTVAICPSGTVSLTDATTGGTWSSSNATTATVSAGGVVTGVSAGVDTIKYGITNSCGQTGYATRVVNVTPLPVAGTVSGPTNLCAGTRGTFTCTGTGGSWSSTNTSAAAVNATTGVVSAITGGTTTIKYTVSNSCGSSVAVGNLLVSSPGYIAAITGSSSECIGTPVTFSSTSTGGTWTSGSPSIATVGSTSGAVYGVSAGTAVITYSLTNACGTVSTTRSMTVYAYAPSPGTLGGPTTVALGSTITITRTGGSSSGVWSSVSASVATVGSGTGVVTGVAVGSDTIKYTVTNTCGSNYSSRLVSVTAHRDGPEAVAGDAVNIHVYPNPTTGLVTLEIKGTTGTVNVMISDMSGKTVDFRSSEEAIINFDMGQYAPGIYLVKISVGGKVYIEKVVVQ